MLRSLFVNVFSVALLAAVGNGIFAYGQRRSTVGENPFIFVLSALVVCVTAFAVTLPFFPRQGLGLYVRDNLSWIALSGLGFYLTFIGFYFLYTRYGAIYYVLYAVLSILTTSVLVGMILFHEQVNGFHLAAIGTALVTVMLFAMGQFQG